MTRASRTRRSYLTSAFAIVACLSALVTALTVHATPPPELLPFVQQEQPRQPLPAVIYERVPADEWPPAAAADLREIPQEDWNTWVQELESKRLAPVRLEAWQWDAQFYADDRTLSGEFRLNIARAADHEELHLLPLGDFSAAISGNQLAPGFGNARWISQAGQPDEPAILGNQPDGRLALLVDRDGVAAFSAIQRAGSTDSQSLRFELNLPQAPRRSIRLQLPAGLVPRLHGAEGIVLPGEAPSAEPVSTPAPVEDWEVLLPAAGPVTLLIEESRPTETARLAIPVVRQEHTEYRADRTELIIDSSWEIRFPSHGTKKLHLHVPPRVELRGFTANGDRIGWRHVTFESIAGVNQTSSLLADDEQIPDWQAIEVEVPRDWASETQTLEAIAIAPLAGNEPNDLPRLVFSDAFWQSGTAKISVRAPLRFSDLTTTAAECVSGVYDNQVDVQLFDPLAEIQLAVQRRASQPSAAMATRLQLADNRLTATTRLQFSPIPSASRKLELALSRLWQVTAIAYEGDKTDGVPQQVNWTQEGEERDGRGGVITLDLTGEDPGQQGFSLLVSATRIPNLAAEVSGQAIVPVRPLQTTVTENLLFLPPDGVQPALQVFGLDEVDPETVFAQSSGLVAVVPKQRVFDIQAIASSARVTWREPANTYSASISVRAEVKDEELYESFELRGFAASGKDEVLVYVSESRDGAALQWVDSQEQPLTAERIAVPQQFDPSLPASGEVWRIELSERLRHDPTLIGRRTSAVDSQSSRVGFVSLLNSNAYQLGELVVAAPTGAVIVPTLDETSPDAVLPLWPIAEDFSVGDRDRDPTLNVARFSYRPDALRGSPAPVVNISHTSAVQSSSSNELLRQPLVWQETLHWSLQTTGNSLCLSICEVQQRQSRQFVFKLPVDAKLIDAKFADQSVTWTQDENGFQLDLPRSPTFAQLRITYSVRGNLTGLTSTQSLPWIDHGSTVFSRTARLHLPHDLRVAHAEQLPSASLAPAIAGRLLGPIASGGQLPDASVARGELSAAALQLVGRFAADVRAASSQSGGEGLNGDAQSIRQLLSRVATKWQRDGRQLLVDAAALGRAGWRPSSAAPADVLADVAQTDRQSRLHARPLALAIIDARTLIVTTLRSAITSRLCWNQAHAAPVFESRDRHSAARETAWMNTLAHPAAWKAPAASPWSMRRQAESAPTFMAESVYILSGNTQQLTLANVEQQSVLNGFVLAIAAVFGWVVCRQRSTFTLVAAIGLAVISLIVPGSWAMLFGGLPLAFVGGALGGFVAGNGARLSAAARNRLNRRLRTRTTTTAAGTIVLGLLLAGWASGESSALSSTPLVSQDPVPNTQPRGAVEVVYVKAGAPEGDGTIFASDGFVTAILARLDEMRMRPRGYLLSAAEHRLAFVDKGIFSPEQLRVALSFTVHALEPMVDVQLPLRRDDFQVATPQAYVTPLGRDSAVTWADNSAQLTLRGVGEHTVDMDLTADESRALPGDPLAIALPQVANTLVEIGAADRPSDERQIRIVGPFARIREFPLAGFSMVTLGPAEELQLNTRETTQPLTNEFSTQILSRLQIGNNRTQLNSRLILSDSDTFPPALTVQFPAGLILNAASVDGRVVTSRVSVEETSDTHDTQLLSMPLGESVADEVTVDLEFSLSRPARFGQLRFPRIRVQGAQAPVELWAVTAEPGLQVLQQLRRQVIDVERDAFSAAWEASVNVSDVVRPVNTNAQWHLSVRPPSGNDSSVEEAVATLRQGGASYEYTFDIMSNGVSKCAWQAKLPESIAVDRVTVTNEAGDDLLSHWVIGSDPLSRDRQLVVFTSRLEQGSLQFKVEASQEWETIPPFVRPPLLPWDNVSVVSSSFKVYCENSLQASFVEPVVPLSPEEGPSLPPPSGTYLAGALALAPGVNPPRVSLTATPDEIRGHFATRLHRADGAWRATVRFTPAEDDKQNAPQIVLVPKDWQVIGVSPASCRVQSLPDEQGDQRLRLSWDQDDAQALPINKRWEVTFAVGAAALQDFAIPKLELPAEAFAYMTQQLIVPRAAATQELIWETQSTEEIKSNAGQPAEQSIRVFQVIHKDARASLRTTATSAIPVVSLIVAQASRRPQRSAVATYFVQPNRKSRIAFRLPSGMNLLHAEINGLPAQTSVTSGGVCTLQLLSASQPQRVGLCLIGDSAASEVDEADRTVAQIAEPLDFTVGETIWIEEMDPNRNSATAGDGQLTWGEVQTRMRSELDVESLNWEATSPLALALLAREIYGTSDATARSFWPAQACTNANDSPLQIGQTFSGERLEFAFAQSRYERTTWPRWVLSLGLLAAAAMAWPQAIDDRRPFAAIKRRLRLPLMLVITGACLLAVGAWLTGSAALVAGVAWSTAALLRRGHGTSAA